MQEIDFLQAPRIQQLREQISTAESESDKKRFLAMLAKEIIRAINTISLQKFDDNVTVNNFDEVTAALRNELGRANKPITDLLAQLNISTQQKNEMMSDIKFGADKTFQSMFQPVLIKRPRDIVHVDNFDELTVPNDVSVNNLKELEKYFTNLADSLKSALNITIPEPRVTVNQPAINIPETTVNIPPVSLEPVVEALEAVEKSLRMIRTNNKSNPLAVRLTDGAEWMKELQKQTAQTTQFMSDVSYIRNAAGLRINPATEESTGPATSIGDGSKDVTTAGTRVQLTATPTPCKYVVVTAKSANTDTIWVGGATVAAGSGRPLVSLQAEKIDINDVSKIYIDSVVNSEGVTFFYVS